MCPPLRISTYPLRKPPFALLRYPGIHSDQPGVFPIGLSTGGHLSDVVDNLASTM
ncbi:hypothetical protein GGQ88_003126 [Novosphingobium hassiacum]|uniref:Uncharacterized protein n=1 Tax=Novosphingobium hassiacum TaxID=173676 RepID=A0A7W5ZYG9_9SPHN|nr:hypothetical protein [Novosphingobium hassiacum]